MYDTTLGYADHEGFRAGVCHPFKPFNMLHNKIIVIWEIPLVIMDVTLANYRRMSYKFGYEIIKSYIKIIEKYKGTLVFLYHNFFIDEAPGWENIYDSVLDMTARENALITSGNEIIRLYEMQG